MRVLRVAASGTWVLSCAVHRLRGFNLLFRFVFWSFVVAFVVGVAISPGTPRYRRTRHTERLQGKALYFVRTPPANDKPTTQRRANEWPTHPRGICMAWRPRRRLNYAWAPLCSSPSPGRKVRSSTWPVPQVPPALPICTRRTHARARIRPNRCPHDLTRECRKPIARMFARTHARARAPNQTHARNHTRAHTNSTHSCSCAHTRAHALSF